MLLVGLVMPWVSGAAALMPTGVQCDDGMIRFMDGMVVGLERC